MMPCFAAGRAHDCYQPNWELGPAAGLWFDQAKFLFDPHAV